VNTWVISADFSRKGNSAETSPLFPSLMHHRDSNLIIFAHDKATAYGPNWASLIIPSSINPMSPLARSFRKILRMFRGKFARRIISKSMPKASGLMIPHNLRHFFYQKILSQLPENDFVFLVDSRDLIFQESALKVSQRLSSESELHFFDEREVYFKNGKSQLIKDSEATLYWLSLVEFDEEDFEVPIREEWILNGGCFAGRVALMREYNNSVCTIIENSQYRFDEILDQVATILPAYSKTFRAKSNYHKNGEFVLNMCGVPKGDFEIKDGRCYFNNHLIPIVHQFDRFGTYDPSQGITLSRRPFKTSTAPNVQC